MVSRYILPEMADKPREECGVLGIYAPGQDVATLAYYGLYALQHRGQESAGIAVSDGEEIHVYKNVGLVAEVFNEENLAALKGHIAIGHVRYARSGTDSLANAQPLCFRYLRGMVAIANNGSLTNAQELRLSLSTTGSVFQSSSDTEVIINLIARYGQNTIEEALMKCLIDLKGAYSLVVMTEDKLIGLRDPYGVRPLCLGKMGDAFILASESCALDTLGAEYLRDVEPGEIVVIDENGLHSIKTLMKTQRAFCVFELVYLARPDSVMGGEVVNEIRRKMGWQLAQEKKLEADVVVAVPDSGMAAAAGYAEGSGLTLREGLMKNRYIGRTFIQPSQKLRDLGVRLKLNPIKQVLKGQRVVLVDDSMVRGTTSKKLVQMLKASGAKEVHLLISSPPILYPCYYGIDTSTRDELIAARQDVEGIRKYIGADSLHFLSLEGLLRAVKGGPEDFCTACFTGNYPLGTPEESYEISLKKEAGSR